MSVEEFPQIERRPEYRSFDRETREHYAVLVRSEILYHQRTRLVVSVLEEVLKTLSVELDYKKRVEYIVKAILLAKRSNRGIAWQKRVYRNIFLALLRHDGYITQKRIREVYGHGIECNVYRWLKKLKEYNPKIVVPKRFRRLLYRLDYLVKNCNLIPAIASVAVAPYSVNLQISLLIFYRLTFNQ